MYFLKSTCENVSPVTVEIRQAHEVEKDDAPEKVLRNIFHSELPTRNMRLALFEI